MIFLYLKFFQSLYVKPEFRKLGLSKILIDKLRSHGSDNFLIITSECHEVAIKIYKRMGFEFVKTYDDPCLFGLINHSTFLFSACKNN